MTSPLRYAPRPRRRPLPVRAAVLLAALFALLGAYLVATMTHADAAEVVVSENRPVTASSVESAATPAAAAVDGDTGTRWSSAFAAGQWFQVDLGAPTAVSRIAITWENAYAKAFAVQFSTDGTTYTQAYATTSGTGGQQSVPATGTARYVRLDLTVRALAAYGYSFWEFQVLAGGTATPTSPPSTTAPPTTAPPTTPPPATGGPVTGVALVNDVSHKPILGLSPVTEGPVVDLTKLANRNVSLQANVTGPAGSVVFTLTGATGSAYTRTESTAPYFLCNDYVDCPLLATADSYTLTVQAYAGTGATGGALGSAYAMHFRVSAVAVPSPVLDVLFVGNSLIGTATGATGEDTPALVRHLATTAGRTLRVTEVIHFGNTLQQTWDAGEVTAALSGSAKYDYIVLQEYSTLVATNPAQATNALVKTYAPTFGRALKPGGRVVLFKNWALVDRAPFASRAADVAAIDTNYAALSGALATANLVVPISDEFETVVGTRGTSYLIVADGKHPDDTAIYLDAATLYGVLFHESPRGLSDQYLATATAAPMRDVAAAAIGY